MFRGGGLRVQESRAQDFGGLDEDFDFNEPGPSILSI